MRDPLEAATALLDAVVDGYAQTDPTGAITLPDMRYVAEGSASPPDGDQLTVVLVQLYRGMPGGRVDGPSQGRADRWCGQFTVDLLRTRRAGLRNSAGRQSALPTKTRNAAGGATYGADMLKMQEALQRAVTGNLVVSHWQKIALGPIRSTGPEGELVGIQADVSMLLL